MQVEIILLVNFTILRKFYKEYKALITLLQQLSRKWIFEAVNWNN